MTEPAAAVEHTLALLLCLLLRLLLLQLHVS
jgi:hypothetical protein